MLAIMCGGIGTGMLLLVVLVLIVRTRCAAAKDRDDNRDKYYSEEEALIARKKLGTAPSYNISSNRMPNNKLKNHYNNINNADRRQSQVLIQNPITHPIYSKPTVPDNPHVTIHNNLKSSGTEI